MIGHDDKRSSIVVPQLNAFVKRVNHDAGYGRLAEEQRSSGCVVQVAVHPDECSSAGSHVRRWIHAMGKAAVKAPCEEQPLALWAGVRQAAPREAHVSMAPALRENSQRRLQS